MHWALVEVLVTEYAGSSEPHLTSSKSQMQSPGTEGGIYGTSWDFEMGFVNGGGNHLFWA